MKLIQVASSSLGLGPQTAMQVAERLYTRGFIRYLRNYFFFFLNSLFFVIDTTTFSYIAADNKVEIVYTAEHRAPFI